MKSLIKSKKQHSVQKAKTDHKKIPNNIIRYEFISEIYKSIIENKYCFTVNSNPQGVTKKESFDEAIYRVAKEVNKYDSNRCKEMTRKTLEYITNKDFSPAGGIWRAAGNPSPKISFVNCTTQPPVKDSIENIFGESIMMWSRIASYGQGNGIDISGLRPRGAQTNNCAKTSSGAVSFLMNYDASMQVIGAENRRGATKPDIWIYHPDSEEFIACKSDITKLSSQNISVKIDSEFMESVIQNKKIELSWERKNNSIYVGKRLFDDDSAGPNIHFKREINAKELFNNIAFQAWKTGEPGIEFWDISEYWSTSNYHPNKKYHIVSTNGCSEQKLDPFNTCVLASINFYNMPKYTEKWEDWLKERVQFGIRFLDNVIIAEYQENRSPHPIQKQKLKEMTRIGLGFTGIYDWFIKNKITYSSSESIAVTSNIMRVFAETAYRTSIALGKERGSFSEFKKEWYLNSPFIKRLCQLTNLKLEEFTAVRHVCCLSIAPTGTLSMVVGTGGSGCEPSFAPYHERKERSVTGEYRSHFIYDSCVLNELKRRNIEVTKENIDSMVQSPEWVFAAWNKYPNKNVTPMHKMKLMAEIYKYIDSGISVTYNLPENATIDNVKEIYFNAWKNQLKSVTVYRDKSREGILNNIQNEKQKNKVTRYDAAKRPEVLQCDIHHISVRGERWIVLVGLLEEDPYEVFCGLQESIHLTQSIHKGKIIKPKKDTYHLILNNKNTLNIKKSFKNDGSESAMTRLVSLNLRHGVDIKYVVQQLERSEGDMTTFAKAISRVLKKYISEESRINEENCPTCHSDELIQQSGCIICNHCGWSRC
jgi:ribonucleoside-diphosphate reductase alpha chain